VARRAPERGGDRFAACDGRLTHNNDENTRFGLLFIPVRSHNFKGKSVEIDGLPFGDTFVCRERIMTMKTEVSALPTHSEVDTLCVNTIRFLSVDAVQKANSGHPGLPLGAAPMGYVLWTRFLKHNPSNPGWFDRDRFILSAGHGSMLLYSLLYLTGYELPLEQIKRFRQWGSITPGHPESRLTPGVETTTGPLGQGFGNAVGMAVAEAHLSARYNRPGFEIVDHHTYGLASDGDLMEGVSSEAASLAGHLKLGKLICFYDDNHVSLAAGTTLTFTEDRAGRFEAYGWHTQTVDDGNDIEAIEAALRAAHEVTDRPSLIAVRTHLGYGSPNKQDTYEAHGSPLGEEEVKLTKENLGWPVEPPFHVPEEALQFFRQAVDRGRQAEAEWNERLTAYGRQYPGPASELRRMLDGEVPEEWDADIPVFTPDDGVMATRVASGKVLQSIAPRLPALAGGSADLDPSTHTALKGMGDFQNTDHENGDTQGSSGGGWSYAGRNLHFGVREHAMGAILNGLAAHGGIRPFGATFLIFSDYMRPSIRLAALMKLPVLYVFTHDSIGLGEDGPTHQSVEQLAGLRAIPGFTLFRPADANETAAAWRIAIEHGEGPVALVLTRQKLPVLDPEQYPGIPEGVRRGGYILADAPEGARPDVQLVATGSEVSLALEARRQLVGEGVKTRVVSLPSWNLFELQPAEYRRRVLWPEVPILAIEAGASLGWKSYVGPQIDVIGVDRFGASAPGGTVMKEFGFSVDNVCRRARAALKGGTHDT
jgi:transketolase